MKVFIKIFKITTPAGHTNLHIMNCNFMKRGGELDRGSIRSSPRYGLSPPYRLTKEQSMV